MEHASLFTLVVITLLQLCRAQTPNSTPEWYAANDINDTNFSPKPITELFSTETSFSPENPIVVLPPTTPSSPENRGIVSSPSPFAQFGDNPFPPNVIPLSSPEPPSSPPLPAFPQSPFSDAQPPATPQGTPTMPERTTNPQQPSTDSPLPPRTTPLLNQAQAQFPRNNIPQIVRLNQPPSAPNRPPQQIQPPNIQFLLPPQIGNGNFIQGQPTPNGQPNYIVLYQQAPQNIQNLPSANPSMPPSQATRPAPPPQIAAWPPNVVANRAFMPQPQMPNQFMQQPNVIPPFNIPSFSAQPNTQPPINQIPNRPIQQQNNQPINNPAPVNQTPNIQQPINRYPVNQPPATLQGNNQMPIPPYVPNGPVLAQRPRQRNRVKAGRLNNRGQNRLQAPNMFPCQGSNRTVVTGARQTTASNPQNNVITIRLTPSRAQGSRANLQVNAAPNITRPITVRPRQNTQMNLRNYERCLNSCRDKKDRICAAPERDIEINPDTLKGFPSMCHMACHNTFRANPIYGKITNGRCGKLRTRIQTVDKSKVRRDELKKSQYTIISNVPGTVVELAP